MDFLSIFCKLKPYLFEQFSKFEGYALAYQTVCLNDDLKQYQIQDHCFIIVFDSLAENSLLMQKDHLDWANIFQTNR